MMAGALKRYWTTDTRWCALYYEDGMFELRLYERARLVALWPCENSERAFELSVVWRENPPKWPPHGA
jgi:hypothetical protein